jgi:hypothetical protein
VACALGLSCGSGLRDTNQQAAVTQTIGSGGGKIALMEATINFDDGSVDDPTKSITLRRYPNVEHTGAVGPVFELEVPKAGFITSDPILNILAPAEVLDSVDDHEGKNMVIGYLNPAFSNVQWVPDSPPPEQKPCLPSSICGPVQSLEFTNPNNLGDAGVTTKILQLAIVQKCSETKECLKGLACNSGACQKCPDGSQCSLGKQ